MGVCWSDETAEGAVQQQGLMSYGLISWRPAWTSHVPVSKGAILKKREEFWDTAPSYEGRREIWDALRAACEAETQELASIIVESAGIRLPEGSLSKAYDELGTLYQVPEYCISFPTNMTQDPAPARKADLKVEDVKHEALESVQVRVRISTGQTYNMTAKTVQELFAQIEEKTGVPPSAQRAYYCGDEIKGPLGSHGFTATDILQVFLFQRVTKQLV